MAHPIPLTLQKLNARIEKCARCKAENNPLRHIFGGGKFSNPKYFFLFINPTHKNRSSHPDYPGKRRYPFIGVRHLYKGLAAAGFIDIHLIEEIYTKGWQLADEERIEEGLRSNDIYISNFVKCAQPNPINPKPYLMRESLPLLAEELQLVNPEYIITFGLLPLRALTNSTYRMRDILETVESDTYAPLRSVDLGGQKYQILPCYYPLGHGNPPKAQKILTYIRTHF